MRVEKMRDLKWYVQGLLLFINMKKLPTTFDMTPFKTEKRKHEAWVAYILTWV